MKRRMNLRRIPRPSTGRPARGRTATREALLAAAVSLVRAAPGPGAITVRQVVEAAGANLNAVNYHFGSKEALVAEAVRVVIGDWFRARGLGPKGAAGRGPQALLSLASGFLFAEPVASRLALDAELGSGGAGPSLTRETLDGLARELARSRPRLAQTEVRLRTWLLVAAVHQLFLRPAEAREWLGVDPGDDGARAALLDRVLAFAQLA